MSEQAAIGVVGATGAVGTVTLELLERYGFENVRGFASARGLGERVLGSPRRTVLLARRPLALIPWAVAFARAVQ